MTDIPKQIEIWLKSADEDFSVAGHLIENGKFRHGLFFVHLALEKVIKAHYCKNQNKVPPKIHNLVRLSRLAGIETDIERQDMLATLNRFCLEGRYPEGLSIIPDKNEALHYLQIAGEIFKWLKRQL